MRLYVSTEAYQSIRGYLAAPTERIAFGFTRPVGDTADRTVTDIVLPAGRLYTTSTKHGAELVDEVRPGLIQTAHQAGHGLVEVHEHPWPGPRTQFSGIDLAGLADLGPHMVWRLPGRPYIALVVGPDSFDALAWHPDGTVTTLDELIVGNHTLRPTGLSRTHTHSEGMHA